METLQSASAFDSYWLIFRRRWLPGLAIFLFVLTLGILGTSLKKPVYEAQAKLRFKKINPSSSLNDLSREIGTLDPLVDKSNPVNTEAEVIRSEPLIKKTISDLKLKDDKGQAIAVDMFRKKLQVSEIVTTDVLQVSYQDYDPVIASQVVNTLVANYIDNNIFVNRAEAVAAREFLEKQLPKAENNLEQIENSILELQEKNQILSPQEEAANITNNLRDIQQKIADATSEIVNFRSKSAFLTDKLGMTSQQGLIAVAVNQSSAVQEAAQQLQTLESELAQARGTFTEANPKIIELRDKIRLQKELVQKQIINAVGDKGTALFNNPQFNTVQQDLTLELIKLEADNVGLSKQLEYLAQIEKSQQTKADLLPRLTLELRQLERKLDAAQNTYDLLLTQLKTIEVAEKQNIGNVRVISYATVPSLPISSRSVDYLASFSLGLIAAGAVIYFLEATDKSVKTVDEAKNLFGYTWLGMIPLIDKSKLPNFSHRREDNSIPTLIVKDYPSAGISESYRVLHSNLKFLCCDNKIKTIVITSSTSQEGKSSVAANLATAMAQVGKKVLLLDANLHSPMQHRIWDIYSEWGLSNLIVEQLDPQSVAQTVMINLDLIASGAIPPSPATLLDSQRMKSLVDHWSKIYDFIIIDAPALDKAADALTLGRMADGVLLTVKPNGVNRSQAGFAKELLAQSGQNILGIVFNGVRSQTDSQTYSYHSLEDLQQGDESLILLESPGESLWETVSRYQKQSKKNRLNLDITPEKLSQIPLEEIESTVAYLQQDLEQLTRVVKEQEDELFLQNQTVRTLQRKVNLASQSDRFTLEQQLLQEQERKNMLEETLVGQRRNLAKRQQLLRECQDFLLHKL